MLEIKNLEVKAKELTILKDFNLEINSGEIHVLMGPNGIGKSTICKVLMRHPDYKITKGDIVVNKTSIINKTPTDMGNLGFFFLAQNPLEIEGISNADLLRSIISEKTKERIDIFKFNKKLNDVCCEIGLDKSFIHRDINFNMSGGEKKKNELLHLFMLEPSFVILDEIDSGLDVDAMRDVGEALRKYYDKFKPAILFVTHHADILKYFDDYQVHILKDGKIIKSGDKNLIKEIENSGFKASVINGLDDYE